MEWTVPVNEILSDKITKLNYTLIPPGFHGDVRNVRLMQDSLSKLINYLGEQSAYAQGLHKVITTADKLRNSPTHILYLLKDNRAKGGKGDVIGLLKVGQKHLFLFDERNKVCEAEPLCVLDFYVAPDRQRHGYGKLLFDYMLIDLETSAEKLAIDGPSSKMEQFLRKNYGIENLMHQKNNFAVSPQFFATMQEMSSKPGHITPVATPAVGRFAAHKPVSAIGTVIHGGGTTYQDPNNGTPASASPDAEKNGASVPELEQLAAEVNINDVKNENYEDNETYEQKAEDAKPGIEELADLQKSPERPSSLKVEPVSESPVPVALSPAGSTISRRDSQLTDRGYFDVKFYHNKLW
ncbi:alpha-tubulin N-acetyltransferase 1-like [Nymphalis io]|uniref:alpha-tubulin N-acetyltransferase 1-like n=1 Tax=Inachis io TaxID=171585 RepID=UPI00216AA124|nr:alpha-tubulin N-acetyltransferase 1-like [Nymphalis io]